DWIKENTFVINSHTNIYNDGRIEVPRAYDLADSWLNNLEYKRTKNVSIDSNGNESFSDNIVNADDDFVELNTLPGGIQTFNHNWGHGTTITTWQAIDSEDNFEQNAGTTTVIVNDNFGPLFNNIQDDWSNSHNFSLTSYTNKISEQITLPTANDAVWGEITKFSYDISGGEADPQSISSLNEISGSEYEIEFTVITSNLEGPDSSGESKYQKYTIDWHCKDNDMNTEENKAITTIKIKDEYGPIFENDASGAAQAAIVPTDVSGWTASLKADTSSSHEGHKGHIDQDTVYLTIDKPKAFDNVDGEITNFDYVLTPANRLADVSGSLPDTGSVTASSSLVLKFKLNSAYFEEDISGNIHQKCTIDWSCVDAAGNDNENTATTTIRIYDTTTPTIDTSGTIYADANSDSVSEGDRITQMYIDLPMINDNVSNGLGDGTNNTLRLEYKIFDHTWNSSFGWESDKLANISDDKSVGTNITSSLNINFVLSAENIHSVRAANIASSPPRYSKCENFYISWKATDNANNYYITEQLIEISDVTVPTLTVDHISVTAASDNSVNTLAIELPDLTDNLSTEFGNVSDGKIKLDYKIFDYDWDDSNGDDFDNNDSKLADNASPNEGTDISGAFYVDFTLSGENIFAITYNYENFYIYWKATDSANNISYKKQEVRITDNTAPTLTVSTISPTAASDNIVTEVNIVLPTIVTNNNLNTAFGSRSDGKIKLDYKIFDHTWIEDNGWNSDKDASVGTNPDGTSQDSGVNITSDFNVKFTLSAENIHTIREAKIAEDDTSDPKYESFYIYWKATDSANNISYTKQDVIITDNTLPNLTVYDVSGYAESDSNIKNLTIPLPDLTDNLSNAFGNVSDGKIKLDYKIFDYDLD
ncbi:MAG: hypothetical protein CML47_10870, partial [Rhodobacteraceae bacterium]